VTPRTPRRHRDFGVRFDDSTELAEVKLTALSLSKAVAF
jgi:hypothetical protein